MLKILIAEEEVVCDKSITIKEEILATSSTILKNCFPKSWDEDKDYTSRYFYPKDYSLCEIYDNDNLIFSGVIKNTGNIDLKKQNPKYVDLQVLDFKTFLSEGETLDFVISNKTVREAIRQVIDAVSGYGFVIGEINIESANEVIGAYSTLNKTAYDVLQYLSEITTSKWCTRNIDSTTIAIDFYDPSTMPKGTTIEYNEDFFCNNEIVDMTVNYGTRDYRNKQVMLASEVFASISSEELILTDGYNKIFNVQNKIGYVQSIKLNGIEKTVATLTDKEAGVTADFYYTIGNYTFESNPDNNPISAGSEITIEYVALVNGRQIIYNTEEVNRISLQTGRKGVIARYENRNDVASSLELERIGNTYIKYKGQAEVNLNITTQNKDLWNIGEVVYFEAPIDNLKMEYMVKSKTIEIISPGSEVARFYSYVLSSSFNSENQINYFDNQRNKSQGNISLGESIIRNIDIENTANIIFENLQIVEVVVENNNILNSILESPFTE